MSVHQSCIARARSVPIEEVLARRGHHLRRCGSELIGPCPACGGRDRFAVNPKKAIWNCRGCGKGGDVINVVRHLNGCGFNDAIEQPTGEKTVSTLSRVSTVNEKARDQNRVAANLRRVIEQKLVHIAGVGHTGKDESRGERGSNARLADVDLQITIDGNETIRTARITRANDQDHGDLTSYALERVELGIDEDGEPIWTYIVDPQSIAAPKSNRGRKSKNQEDVCLKLLRQAADDIGERPPASNRIPQSIRVVNTKTFVSGYSQGMVASSDKLDTKQKAMRRSLQKLHVSENIGVWGEYVWLTDKSDKRGQFWILSKPHPSDNSDTPL